MPVLTPQVSPADPKIDLGFLVIDLAPSENYYLFLIVACLALTGGLWWVVHSRYGRVFQTIRQDAERAAYLGTIGENTADRGKPRERKFFTLALRGEPAAASFAGEAA